MRLFSLATTATKVDGTTTTTRLLVGYIYTGDADPTEHHAKGLFLQQCFERNVGFSMADPLAIEVPQDVIALCAPKPEPIPDGVYFVAGLSDFFRFGDRKGMGSEFYDKWKLRAMEFPGSPDAVHRTGSH